MSSSVSDNGPMTKRDIFAIVVMHAMILKNSPAASAESAYIIADNMLKEGAKK